MPLPGKHSKQELLGLIEDYRQGLLPLIATDAAEAPPEPLSGARVGACAERSVGTPADLSASLPQGAHTAQSRVGRDLVVG